LRAARTKSGALRRPVRQTAPPPIIEIENLTHSVGAGGVMTREENFLLLLNAFVDLMAWNAFADYRLHNSVKLLLTWCHCFSLLQ